LRKKRKATARARAPVSAELRGWRQNAIAAECAVLPTSRRGVLYSAMSDDHLHEKGRPNIGGIDWTKCPDVESVPGRCSGAWVVKDSRVIVESCILGNAEAGCTAEEIAEQFEVPVDVVRRILAFAEAMGAVYFSAEDELAALLLEMVIEHCAGYSPEGRRTMTSYLSGERSSEQWLDSYGISTNADAMIALYEQGLIDIAELDGPRIAAKVTPEGRALLDRLHAEQERNAAANWRHRQYTAEELASRRDDQKAP
jgi:uncharacterized protein (DUF433 family)